MVIQLLKKGLACAPVLMGLTVRMLRYQGVAGTLGFSKAAFNIGQVGKDSLKTFVHGVNHQDLSALSVCESEEAIIHMPYGEPAISPLQLLKNVPGKFSISKVMAAGDSVTASCVLEQSGQLKKGVIIADFNRRSKTISQLRCYFD